MIETFLGLMFLCQIAMAIRRQAAEVYKICFLVVATNLISGILT